MYSVRKPLTQYTYVSITSLKVLTVCIMTESVNLEDQWRLLTEDHSWPAVLVSVPGAGRGLRLTEDLGAGQVVLEDRAMVVGASERSSTSDCHGCFYYPAVGDCSKCWLSFCSSSCRQVHHSDQECDLVSKLPQPRPHPSSWLMVLRLHILSDRDRRVEILAELEGVKLDTNKIRFDSKNTTASKF